MKNLDPIHTVHLFPRLHQKLMELLKELSPEDWFKPTVCKEWNVKDIVSHLVDSAFRRVAIHRDGYQYNDDSVPIHSYKDLVALINRLNSDWIKSSKRLSPQILIEMMEIAGEEQHKIFATLDLNAKAVYAVAWAGENESRNWMDIAREYTERWHHQAQIREAVGAESIVTEELFPALIHTFMRGLPHTFRDCKVAENAVLKIIISGPGGDKWLLVFIEETWKLFQGDSANITASVNIPGHIAWKLFTKGISKEDAMENIQFGGDMILAYKVLDMVSVIA